MADVTLQTTATGVAVSQEVSMRWDHTIDATLGSQGRALVVFVGGTTGVNDKPTLTSATYAGQSMTLLYVNANFGPEPVAYIAFLENPPTTVSGEIEVTFDELLGMNGFSAYFSSVDTSGSNPRDNSTIVTGPIGPIDHRIDLDFTTVNDRATVIDLCAAQGSTSKAHIVSAEQTRIGAWAGFGGGPSFSASTQPVISGGTTVNMERTETGGTGAGVILKAFAFKTTPRRIHAVN